MLHKISMRGFAEVAAADPKRKVTVFKKFKQRDSAESVGMSNYYVKALSGIRHHHRGEAAEVSTLLQWLLSESLVERRPLAKAKLLNNHRALTDYLRNFGDRVLTIKPGKQLYFLHDPLLISAKPDLVAEEDGKLCLIKLNLTKKDFPGGVNPVMLHLLHEAAISAKVEIAPNQVETLQVASGSRVCGPTGGFPNAKVLHDACDDLIALWNAA